MNTLGYNAKYPDSDSKSGHSKYDWILINSNHQKNWRYLNAVLLYIHDYNTQYCSAFKALLSTSKTKRTGFKKTQLRVKCNMWEFIKHTCSSVTIMKEKRRSSPVSPAVPTDLVILEKNFRFITSLRVLRSYQAVMCSIYTVVLKIKEEMLVTNAILFENFSVSICRLFKKRVKHKKEGNVRITQHCGMFTLPLLPCKCDNACPTYCWCMSVNNVMNNERAVMKALKYDLCTVMLHMSLPTVWNILRSSSKTSNI